MDVTSSVISAGIFFLLTASACSMLQGGFSMKPQASLQPQIRLCSGSRTDHQPVPLCLDSALLVTVFGHGISYLSSIYLRAEALNEVGWAKALCGLTWTLVWASMTFYSAMRTALIVVSHVVKIPPWAISLIFVGVQVALAGSSAYFFARSVLGNDVESAIFFAAQFRIISSSLELQNASQIGTNSATIRRSVVKASKPKREMVFWIYLNGLRDKLRAFSAFGPTIAFVLIMTDAKRFQQALDLSKPAEIMQHDANMK
ncbi:hypothetical protein BJ742DRAFT_737134 [Cladochytrium replicatum]|nr:hypothetical protein BJ742DRAFT_737134 [Cladochytrium replicatum]